MEMRGIQLSNPTLGGILPSDVVAAPESTARAIESTKQQTANRGDIIQLDDGAAEEAERLSYDQPEGRQGKAIYAYQAISTQPRRDALQQMLKVDLYA